MSAGGIYIKRYCSPPTEFTSQSGWCNEINASEGQQRGVHPIVRLLINQRTGVI